MSDKPLEPNQICIKQETECNKSNIIDVNPSNIDNMSVLEKMMAENYIGSMELDDDEVDIMTASYSEIFNDTGMKASDMALNIKDYEETGIAVGFTDEAEQSTPVYEGIDPTQALLYEDRVSAFLNHGFDNSCQGSPQEDIVETTSEEPLDKIYVQNSALLGHYCDPANYCEGAELFPRSLYLRPLKQPVPPIDPSTIFDLEAHARGIATSLDTLIENLTGTLHSISSLTVDCVETYRDGVCKTCDAADSNIKSMYQLMAKCEELSKSMKPIYEMSEQIKEVRRLLDLFESVVPIGGS